MPDQDRRINWSLPGTNMALTLVVIGICWLLLTILDLIFGYGTGPGRHSLFRDLTAVVFLLPLFLRWFRPTRAPVDNDDAYRLHNGTVVTFLVGLAVLTVFASIPLSFNLQAGPGNVFVFILSRWIGVVILYVGALSIENLLLMLMFDNRTPMTWIRYTIVASIVIPAIWQGEAGLEFASSVAVILSLFAFVYSLRGRWVVRLRRDQKYKMLGMSTLGFLGAVLLLVLISYTDIDRALLALSPTFYMLGFVSALLVLSIASGFFLRVLVTVPTAGAMDRRNTEVISLSTFGRLMVDSLEMDSLIQASMTIACDVTDGNSAWIERADNVGEIVSGGRQQLAPEAIGYVLNLTVTEDNGILKHQAREDRTIRVFNLNTSHYRHRQSGNSGGLPPHGSVAVVPLRNGGTDRGVLYVLKPWKNGFDRDDVEILDAVGNQIAIAMEHVELIRRSIERERLRNEMLIAREAQLRLLPTTMPSGDRYEVYAESEPASVVGGDYYDTTEFSDGTVGMLIADVSGKGAGAALYMGMVKGVIRALSGNCKTPAEMLARVNVSLHRHIDSRFFVTMTCVRLLEDRMAMQVARAGHCPTLIVRNDGTSSYHKPAGLGLALAGSSQFESVLAEETLPCESGDVIVLFSDGLAEARSLTGDELGFDRFQEIVEESVRVNPDVSLRVLRDSIFEGISTFTDGAPPIDDSTLVMIRWR